MMKRYLSAARGAFRKKVRRPRRARAGFSLVEMGLALIVASFMIQTAVEVATAYAKRQVTQRTAANLSRVADDVQTLMERSYFSLRAELGSAPGNVIEKTWDQLISTNQVSLTAPPVSPDGGTVRLFFTLRDDAVYAVLMSFDGAPSTYAPRPDPSTKLAGKVTPGQPNRLSGWDFSLDIPEIAELSREDLEGNIGVIRYVSQTVNVDPYLHRIAIPGRPDLNRMEANLDMGGFDLENTATILAKDVTVQDSLTVAGAIDAETIRSEGDAVFGAVSADTGALTSLTASSVDVEGEVNAGSVVSDQIDVQRITGTTGSFNSLATDAFSGGTVYLGTGNYTKIDANTVRSDQVIADRVFIGD